jgi:hypothetical protein
MMALFRTTAYGPAQTVLLIANDVAGSIDITQSPEALA